MKNLPNDILVDIQSYIPYQYKISFILCNQYVYNKSKQDRIMRKNKIVLLDNLIDNKQCFSSLSINKIKYRCRMIRTKDSCFCLLCSSLLKSEIEKLPD